MLPGGLFSTKYASDLAIVRTKTQWLFLLLFVLFFLVVVPFWASPYWFSQLQRIAMYIVIVLGAHILCGLCGLVSLGQAAFALIGAYTVAILTDRYDLNPWLCLPLCMLSAGFVGMLLGVIALRLKLFYLAIATFSAHFLIVWVFKFPEISDWTGGFTGLGIDSLSLGSIDFGEDRNLYILCVVFVIFATIVAKNIQRSNTGRIFVAIRDNELAAEVNGIGLFRNKLLAFFIGCAFAGIGGWMWAYVQLRVGPGDFSIVNGIWIIGMILIGGWGSVTGVFLGVAFLKGLEIISGDYITPWLVDLLPERWSAQMYVVLGPVLGGISIILFMKFAPRGLYGIWERFKLFYRVHPYSSWGR